MRNWLLALLIFLGILSLALALRLFHLTYLPVFADEAIYVRWAQIMASEPTLRFLPLSDGKQPLFMWVLMFIVHKIHDPLFAGRLLSVASGMGTLIGIFVLSFSLFKSKKVSLLASFLYAISPFSVFFDRMALTDSMLSLCGVWTLIFGSLAFKKQRIDFAILTGFSLGAGLLTKSPAIFFAVLLPFNFIFLTWPDTVKEKVSLFFRMLALLGITYVIALAMQSIMRLGPNYNLIASRNQDYIFPLSHIFQKPLDPFIPYSDRMFEWLRIMGPAILIALASFGAFLNFRKRPKTTLVLLAWTFAPIVIEAEWAKVVTARYILMTIPFFCILAASSVLFIKDQALKICIALCISIFLVQSLASDYLFLTNIEAAPLPRSERSGYLEEWTSGTGIKEISDYLKTEHTKNPDKKIVAGTEGFFGTLPDGLQMYMEGTPNTVVIGIGLNITDAPQSLKEAKAYGDKAYLVVNDSRFFYKGDPEDLGLHLIASYEKALRPDNIKEYFQHGPKEHLLFFEVTHP